MKIILLTLPTFFILFGARVWFISRWRRRQDDHQGGDAIYGNPGGSR